MSEPEDDAIQSRKRDRQDEDELAQVIEVVNSVLLLVEENPQLWHHDDMQRVWRLTATMQNCPDIFSLNLPHEQDMIVASGLALDRSTLMKGVACTFLSHQNPFDGVPLHDKPIAQVTSMSEKRCLHHDQLHVQHAFGCCGW